MKTDLIENRAAKKHRREAEAKGCKLLGSGRDRFHRNYLLPCGHEQEVQLYNIRNGVFSCKTCRGWSTRNHKEEAEERGCKLLGGGRDRFHRNYLLPCGHEKEVQLHNMKVGSFKCRVCCQMKEQHRREAADQGCELLGSGRDRFHRNYLLPCGHEKEVQLYNMRVGSFKCRVCYPMNKPEEEAAARGCKLLGSGSDRFNRTYLLPCGHSQTVDLGNMRKGEFACRTCGDHAWTRPSEVYLLEILAPGCMPFLKLGYSNNVSQRFKLYGLPEGSTYTPLKTLPFETGEKASLFERAAHAEWASEKISPPCPMESGSTECYPVIIKNTILRAMATAEESSAVHLNNTTQPMNPIQR